MVEIDGYSELRGVMLKDDGHAARVLARACHAYPLVSRHALVELFLETLNFSQASHLAGILHRRELEKKTLSIRSKREREAEKRRALRDLVS